MAEQEPEEVYVKCTNCGAKAKFIIDPKVSFDWTHFPCPICRLQKLIKVNEEYPDKELEFVFRPESAEQEQ